LNAFNHDCTHEGVTCTKEGPSEPLHHGDTHVPIRKEDGDRHGDDHDDEDQARRATCHAPVKREALGKFEGAAKDDGQDGNAGQCKDDQCAHVAIVVAIIHLCLDVIDLVFDWVDRFAGRVIQSLGGIINLKHIMTAKDVTHEMEEKAETNQTTKTTKTIRRATKQVKKSGKITCADCCDRKKTGDTRIGEEAAAE
jgi:hypothetical protein